jgi:AraC-like DNA-binding protein
MSKQQIQYNKLDKLQQFGMIQISKNHQEQFFQPHRHDFYEIIYITDGYGKHMIDFQSYELVPNSVHLIRPSQIHQWENMKFTNEYDGYIFLFSKDLLPISNTLETLFHRHTLPIIHLEQPIKTHINNLISMIEEETNCSQNHLVQFAFSTILEYIIKLKKEDITHSFQDTRIILLLELIEKHFIDEKSALFYAKCLNLTTKRLNELTKKYLGKTLSSLIIDRNIIEIKRELIYTNISIAELSDKLAFKDSPQFVKYFKQYTSYTPTEFRIQYTTNV